MSHAPASHQEIPLNLGPMTLEDLFRCPSAYPVTSHFAEGIVTSGVGGDGARETLAENCQVTVRLHTVLLVAGPYRAIVSSWGARLLSFVGPDGVDIVIGPRQKDALLGDDSAMGAVVGRVANRIAHGRLTIPGQRTYQLPLNDGPHHLHGGPQGFHQRMWHVDRVEDGSLHDQTFAQVSLTLTSASDDQGYPGQVHVEARYQLNSHGALTVDLISRVTEAITPVNLTHHAYWNLSGDGADGGEAPLCLTHSLFTPLSSYLETDHRHLPTGRILEGAGTAFDFSRGKTLGADLPPRPKSSPVGGYDVYLTDHKHGDKHPSPSAQPSPESAAARDLPMIARLQDGSGQRSLEIRSNQPGFQLYTGNYLRSPYRQYQAVCIEPSGLVDAVNHPQFPSILVQPGETVRQTTVFQLRA